LIADSLGEYQLMRILAHNELRTDLIGVSIGSKDTEFKYNLFAKDVKTGKQILKASVKTLYWYLRGIQAAYRMR